MKNISIYSGDIFLVDFNEGAGHEFQGERPAVIVESDNCIKKSDIITIIPLTSNTNNKVNDDLLLKKDNDNRLRKDSIIKVDYITSFDQSRFINKIGIIDKETVKKIKMYLKKHFDI